MAFFGKDDTAKDALKAALSGVGSYRSSAATDADSAYGKRTVTEFIPAELSERMGLDKLERSRIKILLAANVPVDKDGKLNEDKVTGAQKLLIDKIKFHKAIETNIMNFIKEYAQLYYEHGLLSRKAAVKRAANLGTLLLDDATTALEGDETNKVLEKAPNQSGNLAELAKYEHKAVQIKDGKE
jgi:hypothetical protein